MRLHTNCKQSAWTELTSLCAAALLRDLSPKDMRRAGVLPVWWNRFSAYPAASNQTSEPSLTEEIPQQLRHAGFHTHLTSPLTVDSHDISVQSLANNHLMCCATQALISTQDTSHTSPHRYQSDVLKMTTCTIIDSKVISVHLVACYH